MSDEKPQKHNTRIEQWPTSKVLIYPTRASIHRSTNEVNLHPGLNEIIIADLTSLADPDSIRVSGNTSDNITPARITDLTVELVDNIFAKSTESKDDASDDDDEEEVVAEPQSLVEARKALADSEDLWQVLHEQKASAEEELHMLEGFARTVSSSSSRSSDPSAAGAMRDALGLYAKQRKATFDIVRSVKKEQEELRNKLDGLNKVVAKEVRKHDEATKEAREKARTERAQKKQELREEREEKPETVYRVHITIDVQRLAVDDVITPFGSCLNLTYTTSAASWTPHYDLVFDTTNPALSTLTYRALFTNQTCETWTNAPITLSTSQAAMGGLHEKVPSLQPWRASLTHRRHAAHGEVPFGEEGLFSAAERVAKELEEKALIGVQVAPVYPKNGRMNSTLPVSRRSRKQSPVGHAAPPPPLITVGHPRHAPVVIVHSRSPSPRSRSPHRYPVHRRSYSPVGHPAPPVVIMRDPSPRRRYSRSPRRHHHSRRSRSPSSPVMVDRRSRRSRSPSPEDLTLAPEVNMFTHAPAGADTYGLTTTYDLPTPRTIPSSSLTRRHVIAEISLPALVFTHTLIPKLKAAAFLKARLTNNSTIPLLPGPAGLTLDGSFIGTMSFPRCAPAESVTLDLGCDQGIRVEYERPFVKRGTQGIVVFGKEEVGIYKRLMRITNTKGGPVSIQVLDQVPVAEDEKLVISILSPQGLVKEGDVVHGVGTDGREGWKMDVPTVAPVAVAPPSTWKSEEKPDNASIASKSRFPSFGKRVSRLADALTDPPPPTPPKQATAPVPGHSRAASVPKNGSKPKPWGSAKASLLKNGELKWDVDLTKGGSVALALQWESRIPTGQVIRSLS